MCAIGIGLLLLGMAISLGAYVYGRGLGDIGDEVRYVPPRLLLAGGILTFVALLGLAIRGC